MRIAVSKRGIRYIIARPSEEMQILELISKLERVSDELKEEERMRRIAAKISKTRKEQEQWKRIMKLNSK